MSTDFESLIKELRVDYLKSFPEKIANLNDFFSKKDWEKLENEFHKIKGTGKTYGIPEMSEICGLMEGLCRNNLPSVEKCFPLAIQIIKIIENAYNSDISLNLKETESFHELTKLASAK